MPSGASHRFIDDLVPGEEVGAANLNSLDMGGNVSASDAGGLKVDVSAIRGLINSAEINYAGASEQALNASQTNYLYLNSAGTLVVNTTGFPSYPGTRYFPLAVVICGSSTITSIADRRWKFFA